MRKTLALTSVTAALLAGCSQENPRQMERTETFDVADSAASEAMAPPPPAMSAPDIAPQTAPGVAFTYRYAFVLPDERIAAVQEQHAAACEKLGIARCRVTGMRYTLVEEDRVEALLQFKLAPDLARGFGKEGIAAVEKAAGKLIDAAISGDDVGTRITASQKRSGDLAAQISRIEARLAGGGLSADERVELRQQIERLRQQQQAERETRSSGEEALANTPMTYTYAGDAGFSLGGDPFGDAARGSWSSFTTMLSLMLLAIGVLLPWAILAALLVLVWRSPPVRRLLRRPAPVAEPQADAPTG